MNNKDTKSRAPAPPAITAGDLYHIFFRNKWKIFTIWIIGLAAAGVVWKMWPISYQAEAQLLVHYVLNYKSPNPVTQSESVNPATERGTDVLNSEVQLLRSFDLALRVVDALQPSGILTKLGGRVAQPKADAESDRVLAARRLSSGLTVTAQPGSAVIQLTFNDPDARIVQPILSQVVASYLKWQGEVYRPAKWDEALTQQTDELRSKLHETDEQLRAAKRQLGILSLDDSEKAYTERITKIQEAIANAQADLEIRESVLTQMTNMLMDGSGAKPGPTIQDLVPKAKINEYIRVCGLVESLRQIEKQLLTQYLPDSPRVEEVQKRIDSNRALKEQLEQEYPELVGMGGVGQDATEKPVFSRSDIVNKMLGVRELKTAVAVLTRQLADIRTELTTFDKLEANITDLERKRNLQQTYLSNFSENLFKGHIDEAMGSDRLSNISVIESPTPPFQTPNKLLKMIGMILFGAFAGGLGLAFVNEFYLEHSFRRPIEIEKQLHFPLFLSIPRSKLNGKRQLANGTPSRGLLTESGHQNGNGAAPVPAGAAGSEILPWSSNHVLHSYFDTLRDRLISYCEVNNLTHKPKLVAVTSCGEGSGVSTIASGLAAALSETGDGNVLLVDMNVPNSRVAAYFHKGELQCGLDEALESEKRGSAQVQDNLYVVSETTGDRPVPGVLLKRFSNMIPKLRASDYDYIIFDMPPVSQISTTPRVARFMDVVFLVVEAERTDREAAKRATELLGKSQANVGIVLNKTRNYLPKSLQQEI